MLDLILPYGLLVVWAAVLFWPEREDVEKLMRRFKNEETEESGGELLVYDAFKGLDELEFSRLPRELMPLIPDKCNFCRWCLECDPLEMACATNEYCKDFKERGKTHK